LTVTYYIKIGNRNDLLFLRREKRKREIMENWELKKVNKLEIFLILLFTKRKEKKRFNEE